MGNEVWMDGIPQPQIPQCQVSIGYKAIDIVGFNASHCVAISIKFCSNGVYDCGRYDPYLF